MLSLSRSQPYLCDHYDTKYNIRTHTQYVRNVSTM